MCTSDARKPKDGQYPLHLACAQGSDAIVEVCGCSVLPLVLRVIAPFVHSLAKHLAQLLLKAGCDIDAVDAK